MTLVKRIGLGWGENMIKIFLITLLIGAFNREAHCYASPSKTRERVGHLSSKAGNSGFQERSERKIGVGTQVAGSLGILALKGEVNLSPQDSLSAGAGLGSGYQTYGVEIKRVFIGGSFLPFLAAGFSQWYSVLREGQSMLSSNPEFLASRFLTEEERRTGNFSKSFIYPSVGLQYHQLKGPWRGTSIYAQVLMLMEIERMVSAPTGALGVLYYF